MFWYFIPMTGSFDTVQDYEDIRVTDNRGIAKMAVLILGFPVKVKAK